MHVWNSSITILLLSSTNQDTQWDQCSQLLDHTGSNASIRKQKLNNTLSDFCMSETFLLSELEINFRLDKFLYIAKSSRNFINGIMIHCLPKSSRLIYLNLWWYCIESYDFEKCFDSEKFINSQVWDEISSNLFNKRTPLSQQSNYFINHEAVKIHEKSNNFKKTKFV